jgi:hypothetical protein
MYTRSTPFFLEFAACAKRIALAGGRTATSLIRAGQKLVLKGRNKAERTRVLPPVSTASGGPMPGVNLTDFSALQDVEDVEYVERMREFK